MFGPGDFLVRLAALARVLPALPLFGAGTVRLQPVYVKDVAAAAVAALQTPAAAGQLYELGGPRIYSYRALVQLALDHTGRRRLLVPVPYAVWRTLAAVVAPLPHRPISRDQVTLMAQDNVVAPDAFTFADLGLSPTALETIAPGYLGSSRGPG
jgi:NADH dehydrogenase